MVKRGLDDYANHVFSMRNLTKNSIVNTYWHHIREFEKHKKLPFIIRGNLQWKSASDLGIRVSPLVTLISNRYEGFRKKVTDEPVKRHLQSHMNIFEIWGIVDVEVDKKDAEKTKKELENAIEIITATVDALSFQTGTSLIWYPGRFWPTTLVQIMELNLSDPSNYKIVALPRYQEEIGSIIMEDNHLGRQIQPFLYAVEQLPDSFRDIITRSLNWHTTANKHGSGLNRYLNYWSSIELLASWYFEHIKKKISKKVRRTNRRKQIMGLIESTKINMKNCEPLITECFRIIDPSTRTKIDAYLRNFDKHEQYMGRLFGKDTKLNKHLYNIRNDIAHGNISEHDLDTVQAYRTKLHEMRNVSAQIILESINKAPTILISLKKN